MARLFIDKQYDRIVTEDMLRREYERFYPNDPDYTFEQYISRVEDNGMLTEVHADK